MGEKGVEENVKRESNDEEPMIETAKHFVQKNNSLCHIRGRLTTTDQDW